MAPLRRRLRPRLHPSNQPTLPKLDSPLIGPDANVSIPWYKFFFLLLQRALGGTPIGGVQFYAGSTAPQGWILAQGQDVSRTTYDLLFGAIGTTYGAGDGVSTFTLPDCRGRAIFGLDAGAGRLTLSALGGIDGSAIGNSGGEQAHALTSAEAPALNVVNNAPTTGATAKVNAYQGTVGDVHNTIPPGIVFNCIIFSGVFGRTS